MKIAVTGATGKLGGGIIKELLQRGTVPADIVPIVRSADKAARFVEMGMAPGIAAFEDRPALQEAFAGIDKLVVISPPELDNGKRVRQIQNAVFAAEDAGVGHLINVGLVAPEKEAFGLEQVELAVEHLVRCLTVPFTFVRNTVYLDELKTELEVAVRSGELVSATGNRPLNWMLRSDMARATAAVVVGAEHLSKTYDLTSGLFTYDDLAKALGEVAGRPIAHRIGSPEQAIAALVAGGITERRAGGIVNSFQSAIAKDMFDDRFNDTETLIGRRPGLVDAVRRLMNSTST